MLAICDAEKPVAIAGVMGGLDSSITDGTVMCCLRLHILSVKVSGHTSRKLNLTTEASYRFERGVDIENLLAASHRATDLICELAGGQAAEFVDLYPTHFVPNEIEISRYFACGKATHRIECRNQRMPRILSALGIYAKEHTEAVDLSAETFTAPSWRHDIAIEEDLVEEVARHAGYENISDELPPAFRRREYQPTEAEKGFFDRLWSILDLTRR